MAGRIWATSAAISLLIGAGGAASAQAPPTAAPAPAPTPQPYMVGNAVGLPVRPAADGAFNPASANVKVFGSVYSAESCSYDAERGLIVVPNRGVPQTVHDRADLRLRIPMRPGFRSLNVAISAGIALAEALRQTGGWPE